MTKKTRGRQDRRDRPAPARVHGRARPGAGRSRGPRREDRDAPVPETRLRLGDSEYVLERFPPSADATLRAWSAAEEHLLTLFAGFGSDSIDGPLLVLGDPHGVLATVLADRLTSPVVRWTDSYLATVALSRNLQANGLDASAVELVPSTADPGSLDRSFGAVALVVPKTLALLEYQLEWIKPCLAEGARLYAAGMTKHLSPHVGEILESRLGPTKVSRVYKKSVVFTVEVQDREVDDEALTPSFYELDFAGPTARPAPEARAGAAEEGVPDEGSLADDGAAEGSSTDDGADEGSSTDDGAEGAATERAATAEVGGGAPLRIFSFPGVFGAGRLDRGTELLLRCLPEVPAGTSVLDLGCGSGVLGLALALQQPNSRLLLVDESHLAVASARLTFEENGLSAPELRVADGCEGIEPGSVDLVVSNPPFHAKHVMTVEEATRLFAPVRQVLRPDGEFYVVGAHGVDYGPTLRKMFPEVERMATDRRYAVHRCRKQAEPIEGADVSAAERAVPSEES